MHPSLYHLLEISAERFGDRRAAEMGDDVLSYRELLNKSQRLAGMLQSAGAIPGTHVGLAFRKSLDALVAIFAVIRTGATYVPLDPAWPPDRITHICSIADIRLWLGTQPPHQQGIPVVLASQPGGSGAIPLAAAQESPIATDPPALPAGDVANILYTSGSTGEPKGVQITGRSLLHFSDWAVAQFGITEADRVTNHAPYNFDLSTFDIFATVRAGACLLPVPETTKMLPYQMAKFLSDRRATVLYCVPTALTMMKDKLADHNLQKLRHIIFAGEVMPPATLRRLAKQLPAATLTNLYGPTETNVCTWHRVTRADLEADQPLPIGKPISDTRLWIRRPEGTLIENGEAGELLVAGPTVTVGYFGDERLTSDRLIPAPDGQGAAYRTGDLVSRRPDGLLRFHGRIDRMLKCRGHRVEPGEIESVLASHPGVLEAAVVGKVQGGETRIKACIAVHSGSVLRETEIAAFCRARLPQYMLPELWHIEAQLPHTDRGKIDLEALARS